MNIKDILLRIVNGTATEEEQALFRESVKKLSLKEYHQLLIEYEALVAQSENAQPANQILLQKIHQQIKTENRNRFILIKKIAAAAAVTTLLVSGWWWYQNTLSQKLVAPIQTVSPQTAIIPGGNKAILTLADGSTVVLDSAHNGAISTQGNVKVIKLNDGKLSYTKAGAAQEVMYNTIATPKGGQYQLVLADGSKVWLNAASSLKFPTSFVGNERNVTLQGEGYFEIAPDAQKPFHVMVHDVDVAVLGTHFNINSYEVESGIKTTLLEGKVAVKKGSIIAALKPGQQADITNKIQIQDHVDIEEVIAWKNGNFVFNSTSVEDILKQVARWYDVQIVYKTKVSETFSGTIPRAEDISKLLKILEATGKVNFEINGKQIIVKSKK